MSLSKSKPMSLQTWSYYLWTLGSSCLKFRDFQFPGQVRKTDMNKPLCVAFISGENLGEKKNEQGKIRVPLNPNIIQDSGWVKVASGDDVIYTSMSVSPVIVILQGLFLLELQTVFMACKCVWAINSQFPYLSFSPWLFFFSWLFREHRLELTQ